jgi:hypothetical protein
MAKDVDTKFESEGRAGALNYRLYGSGRVEYQDLREIVSKSQGKLDFKVVRLKSEGGQVKLAYALFWVSPEGAFFDVMMRTKNDIKTFTSADRVLEFAEGLASEEDMSFGVQELTALREKYAISPGSLHNEHVKDTPE